MVDLKKEEESYVYLMIVDIKDQMGTNIQYDVLPFKSEKDVKKAMLNIVSNNIRNRRDSISCVSYDDKGGYGYFAMATIEYKSFKSTTYKGIRRKVHEVK